MASLLFNVTAAGQVGALGPRQVGAVVLTGGSAAATLTLYSGTSTSDEKKVTLKAAVNSCSVAQFECAVFPGGVYADISGTGAEAAVEIAG